MDRWRPDTAPRASAAPAADYRGDRADAVWCFDEEMARAFETYYASSRGKRIQQVDFVQSGELAPISTMHAGVVLKFLPQDDGITFRVAGDFIKPLPSRKPIAAKDKPPAPTVTVVPPEITTWSSGPAVVPVDRQVYWQSFGVPLSPRPYVVVALTQLAPAMTLLASTAER